MSFWPRKKTFKFDVNLEVDELSSVPFVSGVWFAKVRLLDGGAKSVWLTSREEVTNHVVRWHTHLRFPIKVSASLLTVMLEKCICRVSVRKEFKGGKSYQKLGFVDINLSQFAGNGFTSERFLLEGYDSRKRQDNSVLKVNISLTLVSGDPCFKVPRSTRSVQIFPDDCSEDAELHSGNKGITTSEDDYNSDSLKSRSSGFGSLSLGEKTSVGSRAELERDVGASVRMKTQDDDSLLRLGQPRLFASSSNIDSFQRSFTVNYKMSTTDFRHLSSRRSKVYTAISHRESQNYCSTDSQEPAFAHVKNADDLVDELIQGSKFCTNQTAEETSLQLFVTNDGRTMIGPAATFDPAGLEPKVSAGNS